MKHYVYKISNIIDDKHYIGVRSSKNPIKDLGIKYFSSSSDEEFMLEQQEFPERFEYNILEVFSTRKLAVAKEIELHNLYDVAVNESFYNKSKQTSIGFCISGKSHTEETKDKMSTARRGKPKSQETKDKISAALTGKSHTEETKDKMCTARRGYTHSQEAKDKIQKAHIARAIKTAYRFIIHDSEGNLIHDELVVNIQKFCSDNQYPAVSFCESYGTNEPVKGGKFKGWTVKRIK